MGRKSSSLAAIASMFAINAANTFGGTNLRTRPYYTPEEIESEKKRKANRIEEINIEKGLAKFQFGSEIIWARDIENATRKAKNKGLI